MPAPTAPPANFSAASRVNPRSTICLVAYLANACRIAPLPAAPPTAPRIEPAGVAADPAAAPIRPAPMDSAIDGATLPRVYWNQSTAEPTPPMSSTRVVRPSR